MILEKNLKNRVDFIPYQYSLHRDPQQTLKSVSRGSENDQEQTLRYNARHSSQA